MLKISDLEVERGERSVLRNFNLEIAAGQLCEIRGANGSGKTSLLRAIAGLLNIKSGYISYAGNKVTASSVHYIGHQNALKPVLTVSENLHFFCELTGIKDRQSVIEKALAQFELSHLLHLPVNHLSEGLKKRVSLCKLAISKRPIWLLDEPDNALDTNANQLLGKMMQQYCADGGLILATTHTQLPIKADINVRIGK